MQEFANENVNAVSLRWYNITDFTVKRDWGQAVIFYILYLLIVFVVAGIAGAVCGLVANQFGADLDASRKFSKLGGWVMAVILCPTLSILISVAKKTGAGRGLLFVLGAFVLSVGGGGLLGLVIPAFLTTRPQAQTAAS